jgi:hypothetical protein
LEKYLPHTNKSVVVPISQKILELNKAFVEKKNLWQLDWTRHEVIQELVAKHEDERVGVGGKDGSG